MKPSKQHPGATGGEITQPGDGVPVAARIFSNYVLIPSVWSPDARAAQARMHGAGLLIFTDQSQQQIKLRTGQSARFAGHAGIEARPAEKLIDEVVSSHGKSRGQESEVRDQIKTKTEERQMTTQIACSVCHTELSPGATACPGCGLPQVAPAIPAMRRQAPIWPYILAAVVAIILVCNIIEPIQNQRAQASAAALLSDLQNGKLNTPKAFQARCGQARWTKQTKAGIELQYPAGAIDYFVTLSAVAPRFQSEHTDWSASKPETYRITLDAKEALAALGCK